MTAFSNALLALNAGTTTRVGSADTIEQAGGLIGTPIGASSPSTGAFTQLSATASLLLSTADYVQRSGAIHTATTFPVYNYNTNKTSAAATGSVSVLKIATGFTTSTVTEFVAGVNGVSNPTFTNTDAGSSSLLAAGDVVVISGANNPANDGVYVVSGVSAASFPQTVTIKGVGTTAPNANTPWVQAQFVAGTGNTAAARKVDIKVQAIANGSAFPDSGGTPYTVGTLLQAYAAGATESDFTGNGAYTVIGGSSSSETLQDAYDLGATITTAGTVDIAFDLADGGFTVDGAGAIDFGGATAVQSFNLATAGAMDFEAAAASTINVTAANLLISTTTSGDLELTSAAALTVDSSAGDMTIGLQAANGTAFAINEGVTPYIVVSTDDPQVAFGVPVVLTDFLAVSRTAGEAITQYALVAINGTSGKVFSADADGTGTLANVVGVCSNGTAADNDPANVAVSGIVPVLFDGNVTTSNIGAVAYLSATAGQATLTAPSGAGTTITRIGVVAAATGTSTASVLLSFQFIAVNP